MMLGEIIATKQREVAARQERFSLLEMSDRARGMPPPRPVSFRTPVGLIAEVKRRSPSAGEIAPTFDPVEQAQAYVRGGADAVSVLTDATYFGGSWDDLQAVREAVTVPVLCKDFMLTPYQVHEARSHGADLLLLIVAALDDRTLIDLHRLTLDLGMMPLVEVHDQHDLARAVAMGAGVIGINNRDLSDFSVDLLTTDYLAPLVPDTAMAVSESGIATRADVERVTGAGARTILVGEALMRAAEPEAKIRELLA